MRGRRPPARQEVAQERIGTYDALASSTKSIRLELNGPRLRPVFAITACGGPKDFNRSLDIKIRFLSSAHSDLSR